MGGTKDVMALSVALKKAVETVDSDSVKDILRQLKMVPVTLDILQKTKIGVVVGGVRKNPPADDKDVVNLCKELVKRWKKVAQAEAKPVVSPCDSSAASTPVSFKLKAVMKDMGEETKRSPKRAAVEPSSLARTPSFVAGGGGGGCDLRRNCVSKLQAMLSLEVDGVDGALEDMSGQETASVAKEVEQAMFDRFRGISKEYKTKFRSLTSNLKANPKLRASVMLGGIRPAVLIAMKPAELATDEVKRSLSKAHQDAKDAARSDYDMANEAKTNETCGIDEEGGLYVCSRCKSSKTTHYALQTRSADEPMTVFVTCVNCGKKWRC